MQVGDLVLIYHSGGESAIQGLAKVIKNPYPASDDVRSWQVDLQFVCEFEEAMGLKEIKATGLFEDFRLVYQSRLSVMPCPQNFVDWLRKVRGWQL